MNKWIAPVLGTLLVLTVGMIAFKDQIVEKLSGTGTKAEPHADMTEHDHEPGSIAYYTCPMHTYIRSTAPGQCPVCNMELVPVLTEEVASGIVQVDQERQEWIGIRTDPVEMRPIESTLRAHGRVTYDETRVTDVSLKYRGWIRTLNVNKLGQSVYRGQPLFTLYSPELLASQEEFLAVMRNSDNQDWIVESARTRLRLWDLTDKQIDAIAEAGKPMEAVPILSPATGVVVEKNVVAGAAVMPGQRLYRLARLDKVWVEADVYESDLPMVSTGQKASVTLPFLPNRELEGTVDFVYPFMEPKARSTRVRIVLDNSKGELKPDMYADVVLTAGEGEEALTVPITAVLYAGARRLVFVDRGEGRFEPVDVTVGRRSGDYYEVLSGVSEGDLVVTSGNFLIAAESRLKSAAEKWR